MGEGMEERKGDSTHLIGQAEEITGGDRAREW